MNVVPAKAPKKRSVSAWLPCSASKSGCISGGIWSVANWQVRSYIGSDSSSRRRWYSASASSSSQRPEKPASIASASSSASRKASVIPCAVIVRQFGVQQLEDALGPGQVLETALAQISEAG